MSDGFRFSDKSCSLIEVSISRNYRREYQIPIFIQAHICHIASIGGIQLQCSLSGSHKRATVKEIASGAILIEGIVEFPGSVAIDTNALCIQIPILVPVVEIGNEIFQALSIGARIIETRSIHEIEGIHCIPVFLFHELRIICTHLERIMYLRKAHDYIIGALMTGFHSPEQRFTFCRNRGFHFTGFPVPSGRNIHQE